MGNFDETFFRCHRSHARFVVSSRCSHMTYSHRAFCVVMLQKKRRPFQDGALFTAGKTHTYGT